MRISAEIEVRLDRLAKKTGRTKTFYDREAILQHLADLVKHELAYQYAQRAIKELSKLCREALYPNTFIYFVDPYKKQQS